MHAILQQWLPARNYITVNSTFKFDQCLTNALGWPPDPVFLGKLNSLHDYRSALSGRMLSMLQCAHEALWHFFNVSCKSASWNSWTILLTCLMPAVCSWCFSYRAPCFVCTFFFVDLICTNLSVFIEEEKEVKSECSQRDEGYLRGHDCDARAHHCVISFVMKVPLLYMFVLSPPSCLKDKRTT